MDAAGFIVSQDCKSSEAVVLSQNARQRNSENRKFSYTIYDELGRVVEVGEKSENETLADGTLGVFYFRDIFGSMVSGHYNPKVIDNEKLNAWVGGDGARNEVTRSYYDVFRDDFYDPISITINQDNQRKRIAHVAYYSTWVGDTLNYDHATHFVYDIHGNVTKLMQDNKKMAEEFETLADHRVKLMEYSYDLVSGNVHRMSVQSGEADQWHHAYSYDADNRITSVHTSTQTPLIDIDQPAQFLANELTQNASNWDLEAKYFYYAHGPLARTELGNQLQGLDYIYNLQGWLKGVNATSLDKDYDPGKDGVGLFSKDVMAFSLHYYDGDYTPIGGTAITPAMGIDYANTTLNTGVGNHLNLYNGNIRFMQTTLTDIATRDSLPMLNAYKYDQLNRLLEARSYTDGLSSNIWNPTTYDDKYFNAFTYDANGNILTQKRHNSGGDIWEDLTYNYLVDGNGNLLRNRLYHVRDYAGVTSPTYNNPLGTMSSQMDANYSDLDDQGQFIDASIFEVENDNNYKYDEEGRLIQDLAEGIEEIVWRVDGKVKKVIFTSASGKNNLEFDYDAFGRRIAKHVLTQGNVLVKSTYYILDAQGNQLSTYEHVLEDEESNYELAERVIYGSSRLGINVNKVDLFGEPEEDYLNLTLGNKLFEMSNHLGNVLTVINDIKIPVSSNSVDVDGYLATIVSTADYSPFGVQLDGRTVSSESYRYGYQGSEKDDEIKGDGNSYTTEYRQLDVRLGRWLSIDPLAGKFPWQSPYVSMDNKPISLNDIMGSEAEDAASTNDDPDENSKSARLSRKQSDLRYKLDNERLTEREIKRITNKIDRISKKLDKYAKSCNGQPSENNGGTRRKANFGRGQRNYGNDAVTLNSVEIIPQCDAPVPNEVGYRAVIINRDGTFTAVSLGSPRGVGELTPVWTEVAVAALRVVFPDQSFDVTAGDVVQTDEFFNVIDNSGNLIFAFPYGELQYGPMLCSPSIVAPNETVQAVDPSGNPIYNGGRNTSGETWLVFFFVKNEVDSDNKVVKSEYFHIVVSNVSSIK